MSNTSTLIWGMLFGAIGLGFFMYGKKQAELFAFDDELRNGDEITSPTMHHRFRLSQENSLPNSRPAFILIQLMPHLRRLEWSRAVSRIAAGIKTWIKN